MGCNEATIRKRVLDGEIVVYLPLGVVRVAYRNKLKRRYKNV